MIATTTVSSCPNTKGSATLTVRMRRLFMLLTMLTVAMPIDHVSAFEVMISTNTLKLSRVPNAVDDIGQLAADGAWFLPGNGDLEIEQWRSVLRRLHGTHYLEDVLTSLNGQPAVQSRDFYRAAMDNQNPSMAFVYNEEGGHGNTSLDPEEIDIAYERYGQTKIIPLTRSYANGPWKDSVDAVIDNPKVGGLCMEPVLVAALETTPGIHSGLPNAIKMVLGKKKKMFILMHTGGDVPEVSDPWTDENHKDILDKLKQWLTPEEIRSRNLVLVYQVYDINKVASGTDTSAKWFGDTQSIKSAVEIARSHPDYTGNRPRKIQKRNASGYAIDGNHGGADRQSVHLWESVGINVNQLWEPVACGNGYYSFIKKGTRFALDGGDEARSGQAVYLWQYSHNNPNQQWKIISVGGGFYRIEKRTEPGYSISSGPEGDNGQAVFLTQSDDRDPNQHWKFE